MKHLLSLLVFICFCFPVFAQESTLKPLDLGSKRELFVDDYLSAAIAFDHTSLRSIVVAPKEICVDPRICFDKLSDTIGLTANEELFIRLCSFSELKKDYEQYITNQTNTYGLLELKVKDKLQWCLEKLRNKCISLKTNKPSEKYWFISAISPKQKLVEGHLRTFFRFWMIDAQNQQKDTCLLRIEYCAVLNSISYKNPKTKEEKTVGVARLGCRYGSSSEPK